MDLDQIIVLTQEDKQIELPLKNLLRLAMVYMQPLKSEWEVEVAKKDISNLSGAKAVLEDFWTWVAKKLGLGEGDQVLL